MPASPSKYCPFLLDCFFTVNSRKRKANRDLAMQKLNEGDIKAASELFQVLMICCLFIFPLFFFFFQAMACIWLCIYLNFHEIDWY